MRLAAHQGWLAIPVRSTPNGVFEFDGESRIAEDGSSEWVYTLRLVSETADEAHDAKVRGLGYRRRYGPGLSCGEIDQEISARKSREARTAEKRAAKAEQAQAQAPDEPRMRLV